MSDDATTAPATPAAATSAAVVAPPAAPSVWSFYSISTGILTGGVFGGDVSQLAANTPAGCGAAPGDLDPQSQRINVITGQVIAYQPPAPADTASLTWAWDAGAMRWVSTPTPAALLNAAKLAYEGAAQALLDSTAQAWGYDSAVSACSYGLSTVPQFKAEAQALLAWRDALWQAAYALEAQVVAGSVPLPASPAAFLALLPPAPARPTT